MYVAKYEVRVNGRRVGTSGSRRQAASQQAELAKKGYRNIRIKHLGGGR